MGVLNLSESNHKARNSELTLNDIDHLPVPFQYVDELRCLPIPDEDIPTIATTDHVLIL